MKNTIKTITAHLRRKAKNDSTTGIEQQRFQRKRSIQEVKRDGQTFFMDTDSGAYFNLDNTAGEIWGLLSTPQNIDSLVTSLEQSFDVPREDCKAQTLEFLLELERSGLVKRIQTFN